MFMKNSLERHKMLKLYPIKDIYNTLSRYIKCSIQNIAKGNKVTNKSDDK